jgi:phenylacetate-CoA ligase
VSASLLELTQPWLSAATACDVFAVSHADATAWQQRRTLRLQALLAHAARHSRVFAGGHGTRLQDWPVTHKAQLMSRFGDWVTDPALALPALQAFLAEPGRIGQLFDGRFMVWESSGSSGQPGVFVQDAQAMMVYDALEWQRRPARSGAPWWPALQAPSERVAFVGATGGHFASVCSIERLRRLLPWLGSSLRCFSFLMPLPELMQQLDAYQPSVLATYPSTALMLAEETAAGRTRWRPREVWTGGETLTPALRRVVRQAFGSPVVDSYGASEFLALACECAHGALHLNSDWVILEPVDAQRRAVPAGRFGSTTLLTNLANRVQPLIRYDIGDRVRIEPRPCTCGSPLPVIEVQGRSDDSLLLHDARGARVHLPPLALVALLESDAGVYDFQLVQCAHDRLELSIAMPGPAGRAALQRARAALERFLRARGLGHVELQGRHGAPARVGRSGKVQRVVAARASQVEIRRARPPLRRGYPRLHKPSLRR